MIIGRAERWERLPGATPASRSDLPFQSDLTRAMRRSRSPFHPGGSRKLTRSDLSERPLQVAPEAQSDLARVTPRGVLLELMISQGPFGHFMMHVFIF